MTRLVPYTLEAVTLTYSCVCGSDVTHTWSGEEYWPCPHCGRAYDLRTAPRRLVLVALPEED